MPHSEALSLVLREAKRLHKAASSDQLDTSLPVLRRLLNSQTLQRMSLPELRRNRHIVQRKHMLRMLAIEAGLTSWEAYRQVLSSMAAEHLPHFDIARQQGAGHLNLWFSSIDEARAHAAQHGGRALPVGQQGVVLLAQ